MRKFKTGAIRDVDEDKYDYEAFLSPIVIERYAKYMHAARIQADGKFRVGDNWQKGIPKSSYIKSAFRHFMDWWKGHRKGKVSEDILCALIFNCMGYLHEILKERK